MRAGYHPGSSREKEEGLKKQGFYHTPAWRRLRKLALQRDHFICQSCLRKKKLCCTTEVHYATEVHHVKPIADFPELALDLDNLESLCWDCHEETKPRKADRKPKGVRVIQISGSGDREK